MILDIYNIIGVEDIQKEPLQKDVVIQIKEIQYFFSFFIFEKSIYATINDTTKKISAVEYIDMDNIYLKIDENIIVLGIPK